MNYRAIKNFRIARQVYDIGAPYVGPDVTYLLERGLIEALPDAEPITRVQDEILPEPQPENPPAPQPGKQKKKKSK